MPKLTFFLASLAALLDSLALSLFNPPDSLEHLLGSTWSCMSSQLWSPSGISSAFVSTLAFMLLLLFICLLRQWPCCKSTCLCILSARIKSVHHLIFIFIIFIFKVSGDRGRHSVLTSSLHTIHTQIHAYTHIRVDISWHAFRPAERERCSHRKTWCFPWGLREERCKQTITGMCS